MDTKKRVILLLIFTALMAGTTMAQYHVDTIYYDKKWNTIDVKPFADYYRVALVYNTPGENIRFKDFYITGELYREGMLVNMGKNSDKETIFDGEITTYYKNGKKESVRHYFNKMLDGTQTVYDNNGLVKEQMNYASNLLHGVCTEFLDNDRYIQKEYNQGTPTQPYYLLGNATGQVIKLKYSDNKPYFEEPSKEDKKQKYIDGELWEYYDCNGLVIAVRMDILDYKIYVVIANNSVEPIRFNPDECVALSKEKNEEVSIQIYQADDYLRIQSRNNTIDAFTEGMIQSYNTRDAGQTVSTSTTTSATFGNVGNTSYGGVTNSITTTHSYDASSAYQARVLSQQYVRNYADQLEQQLQQNKAAYLRPTTINPGETLSGFLAVRYGVFHVPRILTLTMPIEGVNYVFEWIRK